MVSELRRRPPSVRSTRTLFGVLAIDSFTNGVFIPISLIALSSRSGEPILAIGSVLTAAGLVALPVPLALGWLIERVDARSILITAQGLQAAGFATYAVARSLPTVFAAALLVALGNATFWSSVFVLIARAAEHDPDPRARERVLGRGWSLRAVGYGVGVTLAGAILGLRSEVVFESAVAGNAVLLLAAAMLVRATIPRSPIAPVSGDPRTEAATTGAGYRALLANRPLVMLFMLNIAFMLCNATLGIGLGPCVAAAVPHGSWIVGPLLALNTAAQAVCLPVIVGRLRRRRRSTSLCIAGVLWTAWAGITAAAAVLQGLPLQTGALVVAVLCYAAAQMVHSPTSNALAADAAPDRVRARYLALFPSSFAIASVIAPILFSALFQVGDLLPWIALAGLAMLTVPATLVITSTLPSFAVAGRPAAE